MVWGGSVCQDERLGKLPADDARRVGGSWCRGRCRSRGQTAQPSMPETRGSWRDVAGMLPVSAGSRRSSVVGGSARKVTGGGEMGRPQADAYSLGAVAPVMSGWPRKGTKGGDCRLQLPQSLLSSLVVAEELAVL